jgi:hypothetical protein
LTEVFSETRIQPVASLSSRTGATPVHIRELRTFFVSYNGRVPETTLKKLLFAALLVAAFVLGVAIAASIWEGGWKIDDSLESSDSDNRAP